MAAPSEVCTKEEQRAMIRFLWSEGASMAKTHERLYEQYGNSALPQRSVYYWIENSKIVAQVMEEGAGHPSTAANYDKIVLARYMILLNRRVTIDEVTRHCPRIVKKVFDRFWPLIHLPTTIT